ncbi:hypothetical protein VVD49_16075 [Uliginosibacterium sp. H3]|uniref:Uncharacterized protein n=1 Tax=Uliginosibacterium silvisoli TaxID=3114758 RepID=A0ABU6K625_9RHOO|nr:hypothetical protein [Uliginosibacterium sp. H3]
MADPGSSDAPPGLLLWALVLGLTGVVAGVFGPAIFAPQVQRNPLIGALVTGPLALIFGMLLGKAVQRSGLTARLQWQVLFGCAGALVTTTLYFGLRG